MRAEPKGGTLIFSYIRMLGSFFGVQKFEFQYFLGFSEKLIFFWGYEDFVDFFFFFFFWGGGGGHLKIGLYLVVISMHFRVFFKVKVQNRGYFWGCQNFKYFLGCLKFLIFFG